MTRPDAHLLDGPSDAARADTVARERPNAAHLDQPLARIGPPIVIDHARDWHERGIRHELAGQRRAAIDAFYQALLQGGPDVEICFDLASALESAGEFGRAAERYRQVVELDPRRADAWNNLGDLLLRLGDCAAGVDALRRALTLAPDDAATHYNLADALECAGDPAAARPHWAAYLHSPDANGEHAEHARERLASPIVP